MALTYRLRTRRAAAMKRSATTIPIRARTSSPAANVETAPDQNPDQGQDLFAGGDRALDHDQDHAAQNRRAGQHKVVEEELQLRRDLRRHRAAEHALRGAVQSGLEPVAA